MKLSPSTRHARPDLPASVVQPVSGQRSAAPAPLFARRRPGQRHQPLHRREQWLAIALLFLLGIAVFGPGIPQPAGYHAFIDQRSWLGVRNAADVLSNLPFALGGLAGLWLMRQDRDRFSPGITVFLAGLLITSLGSAWYHADPDNNSLLLDRLSMSVAFAGLLGLAAEQRVSARAGALVLGLLLLAGPVSLWEWTLSGNVFGWAVVQFGGLLLLLGMSLFEPSEPALAASLVAVVAIYALAKLCEHFDAQIFAWTAETLSGHSLKHLVASLAVLPVIWPWMRRPR